jgi:hypothetical protein
MCTRLNEAAFGVALAAALVCWSSVGLHGAEPTSEQGYSTCKTWQEVVEGQNLRYADVRRMTDPGTKERPAYTGFWFFDGIQFDESGRYALAMKVGFQERDVTPSDRGEIGTIDLQDKNAWTKIGETTAWNWQQGCRLTWRGGSQDVAAAHL